MAVIALMMTISASAQFYIYFSDGTVAKVDSISMIAPEEPETPSVDDDFSTTYTSNVTFELGNKAYAEEVIIDGETYDAVKLGTSKLAGDVTFTVPANTVKIHMHIAGWNGKESALVLSTDNSAVTITPSEISATSDDGIANSSPYTLKEVNKASTDYYYTVELTGVTEKTTITATTVENKYRVVIWGVNYTTGSNDGGETPEPTPDPEEPEEPTTPNETEGANDYMLDNFEIGGYGLFNVGAIIPGTDTVIQVLGSTQEVTCQLAPSLYYVWDKGIELVNNTLTGAGYILAVESYAYVIAEGAYAGYYINFNGLVVDTIADDAIIPYTGKAGQLLDVNKYGDACTDILAAGDNQALLEQAYELYNASHTGTQFFQYDFNTGSQSYSYGNVSYLNLAEGDDGELYYDLKLEWYDHVNEGRWYGLKAEVEVDEDGWEYTRGIVKPYDMRVIHKEYQKLPSVVELKEPAEAPAQVQRKAKPAQYTISNQKLSLDGNPQLSSLKKIK